MHRKIGIAIAAASCIALLCAAAPAQTAPTWSWKISVADGAKYGRFSSHAILPSGHPAVCHFEAASGHLLYTWSDGTAWHTTVVDPNVRDGRFSSLALLPSGSPAVAYLDYEKVTVKYAWMEGSSWHIASVDTSELMAGYVSLAILPSGLPAICYRCGGLKYAWFDGSSWHTTMVDPDFFAGWCTSIAVQPSGYPAISYWWDYYSGNKELCYAWMNAAGWHINILMSSSYDMCLSTSLAFLPSGEPAVGYSTLYDGVAYAGRYGGTWQFQTVAAVGHYADLAIQASGEPAICYLDYTAGELRYAYPASKGWDYEVIDRVVEEEGIDPARIPSLVIPGSGEPTVAYMDIADDHLRFARRGALGSWESETAAAGESRVGRFSSAAVLPTGAPAVSYLDDKLNDLRYAQLVGTQWKKWLVDQAGGVGISLAVLPSGHPAVSYYDNTNGDLKYAELEGNQWKIAVVEKQAVPPASEDCFTSLAVLPSGRPAIGYYVDQGLFDQKYAWFDGALWRTQTVDKGLVWHCSSLVILPSGEPAMSYRAYDGQDMSLTYACFDGTAWHKTFVDRVTNGGWGATRRENSLIVLPSGQPAVAYYDQANDRLKYAWFDGALWRNAVVDAQPGAGNDCSLALLPSGEPAISYYLERDFMDLKFAWRTPLSVEPFAWHTCTVDTPNNQGTYSSLVVLPGGRVGITYYNWIGAALMYAAGFGPASIR